MFSKQLRKDSRDRKFTTDRQLEVCAYRGRHDLLDLMKLDAMRPQRVVDIHTLLLDRIEVQGDGRVRIGAMVTNTALARHPHIRAASPVLSQAVLSGASMQLRIKATTAGNVMQRVRYGYFRDALSPCDKRQPGSWCAAIDGQNRNVHAVMGGSSALRRIRRTCALR
jgi:xanthine dehydrogenase YagS FAD-binding subunit